MQAMQANSQGQAHEELSAVMKSSEESKKAASQIAEVRARLFQEQSVCEDETFQLQLEKRQLTRGRQQTEQQEQMVQQ